MKKAIRNFKETVEIRSSILNRVRSHRYYLLVLLVCAFLVAACFHVWQRVKVLQLVQETSRLKAENAHLVDDAKKIYAEIVPLKTASRIERYAIDTLGLQLAPADRLFTLIEKEAETGRADDLALMLAAIKRLTRYLPVVSESKVNAGQIHSLEIDSSSYRVKDK